MKITLKEFRQIVRSVLLEEKCPACGVEGAYIGLNNVECINHRCRNFTVRQRGDVFPDNDSQKFTIDGLDWPHDELEQFEELCKSLNLDGEIQEEEGPSGNPVIKVVGAKKDVEEFIRKYAPSEDEAEELIEDILPVGFPTNWDM